jgi:hypothetical protein
VCALIFGMEVAGFTDSIRTSATMFSNSVVNSGLNHGSVALAIQNSVDAVSVKISADLAHPKAIRRTRDSASLAGVDLEVDLYIASRFGAADQQIALGGRC